MKTKSATANKSVTANRKPSGATSKGGGKSTASSSSSSRASGSKSAASKGATAAEPGAAQGLRDLFEEQLKDILWAEKALTKAIPKMIKNASSEELVNALEDHLAVTEGQVDRLEQVFESIGKTARGKKCEAMDGLIKEAEELMKGTEKGMVRDAGIIAAAQKVEHYEIASYGTLCAFAKTLNEMDAADLLEETLNEEKEADETLTSVAESSINIEAASEDNEGEGEEEGEEDDEEVEYDTEGDEEEEVDEME